MVRNDTDGKGRLWLHTHIKNNYLSPGVNKRRVAHTFDVLKADGSVATDWRNFNVFRQHVQHLTNTRHRLVLVVLCIVSALVALWVGIAYGRQ